jgi:heat shock protein HtpX
MRRRRQGRDVGLAVRMVVALAIVGAIYAAGEALAVGLTVSAWRDGDLGATMGGLLFVVLIPALVYGQVTKGGTLALRAGRAKVLEAGERPDLDAAVTRVAAMADVAAPRVALVRAGSPNAFAVARPGRPAVVALTEGLLALLTTPQVEAVLAHEVAHIANGDGLVMPVVGGPALVGPALRRQAKEDDWRAWVAYFLYFPVYVIGVLTMRMMSRTREYVADHHAALITGAPEQLASALLVLEGAAPPKADLRGGAAVGALCIVPTRRTPFALLSDHPPVEKRVARLERMARGQR